MACQALRQELIDAGARLLAVADEAAIRPAAAAWVHEHELGDWRYYVVSPLVSRVGPGPVVVTLTREFHKAGAPEDFSMRNVHVVSPGGPAFELLGDASRIAGSGSARVNDVVGRDSLADVVLYRFDAGAAREGVDELVRAFRARERAVARRREPARGGMAPAPL